MQTGLSLTLTLCDAAASLDQVGGKGASLARLSRAGLPVPEAFHVTTAAYRRFVAENGLQAAILEAASAAIPDQPSTLEEASSRIGQLFSGSAMPDEIAEAIRRAYAELGGGNAAVAVRSSATAEDLPDLSFAGQQATFLNVRGSASVLAAVKHCWASLWTARAIGYRAQHGVDHGSTSLAVVVQLLVPAEAAGVLFTANPVDGSRDQEMITATWGLGEAIVGGLVTPDTLTVEKASGRVIACDVADKRVMTVRTASGTEERPTPEALRHARVLDDRQAAELARLGVEIEHLYGMPMDVEWALADGRLAIVQARPITALPELPPPSEWPRPNPRGVYARSSLAEHLPNPVSPLFGTLGLSAANAASDRLVQDLLGTDLGSLDVEYLTINGYVYIGFASDLKTYWTMARASIFQFKRLLTRSAERWLEARRALAELVARWEARPVGSLSPSDLLEGVREVMLEAGRYYTVIQASTLPSASTSEATLGGIYKLVRRRGDPDATALLFGFDTFALRAEESLFDLAEWARARPALGDYARHASAERLAADLGCERVPEGVASQDWAEWRARFQRHVDRFGRTCYEFDFASPTPAETPATLLETVRAYLEGRGRNPYERQREAVEKRERLTREIRRRFMPFPRSWFWKALRWAQAAGPAREDSLADMGMGHPVVRRMLGELGRRCVEGGAIRAADDIYWLAEDEVGELTAKLERGEPLAWYGERIPGRKAEWRARLRAVPPAVVPATSIWGKLLPWAGGKESSTTLRGIGTSAGRVTAPARVLVGPEDFGKLKPGDVLVAVTTTPAWTPLFALASAVVTDIGGPLSHSSIVAREYGIPAVMATSAATRRIRDGDLITVDGSAGVVTLSRNGA